MLICNEAIAFNPDEIYTNWKTENVVNFENTPVMNNEELEICVIDGSISIKNISGNDITSDILTIGTQTFYNSSLTDTNITDKVVTINSLAYAGTGLKNIFIKSEIMIISLAFQS